MSEPVTILFVGDVVGGIGKRTLLALLPTLRERYAPDFVVVNGENAAGGVGITPKIARELLAAGVDVITLGNHTYRHREVYPYLDEEERILRPANFLRSQPGHGWCVVAAGRAVPARRHLALGKPVHEGRAGRCSRRPMRRSARSRTRSITCSSTCTPRRRARRSAMGWHLDGRVTAVVGTHTHVPTADARILPGGTAYITDVGMTGPRGGVIGVKREQAMSRWSRRCRSRFETSTEDPWLNGVVIRARATGRCGRERSSRCCCRRRGRVAQVRAVRALIDRGGDQAPATTIAWESTRRSSSEAASACSISVGKLPNSATTTNGKNHTM